MVDLAILLVSITTLMIFLTVIVLIIKSVFENIEATKKLIKRLEEDEELNITVNIKNVENMEYSVQDDKYLKSGEYIHVLPFKTEYEKTCAYKEMSEMEKNDYEIIKAKKKDDNWIIIFKRKVGKEEEK